MKELLNDKFADIPGVEESECDALWDKVSCAGTNGGRDVTKCAQYINDNGLTTCGNTICDHVGPRAIANKNLNITAGFYCVQGRSSGVEEEDNQVQDTEMNFFESSGDTCHDFAVSNTECDHNIEERGGGCYGLYEKFLQKYDLETPSYTCSFTCNREGDKSYCRSLIVEEEDMVEATSCDICSTLYEQTIECDSTPQCQQAYRGVNASNCPVTCNFHHGAQKSYCVQLNEDVDATN